MKAALGVMDFSESIIIFIVEKNLATDGGQVITHCFSVLGNLRF